MKIIIAIALTIAVVSAAPIEERDLIGAISSLLGKGGAATGEAAAGGAAAGGAATGGAVGGAVGGLDSGILNGVGGLVKGVFGILNTVSEHGQSDPRNGADIHHHAAESGAQSAILKALANGDFGF